MKKNIVNKALSVSALLKQHKKLAIRQDSLLEQIPTGQRIK